MTALGCVVGKRVSSTLTGTLVLRLAGGGAWVGGQHWGEYLSADQARVRFPPDSVAYALYFHHHFAKPDAFGHKLAK